MTIESKKELKSKILLGLEKAYEKMLLFKKQKNSEVIVLQNDKIVRLKP